VSGAPVTPLVHETPSADDRVNILIVDDRPENLLAVEAILEPLGQHLVRAHSGAEALRHLLEREFACILLDVQMPGMNGFETARVIKSRERTKYIPIIFLTAISKEQEYVFRGYAVGAVDYLFKPFNPDILRSKVAVFVDLYLKQKQLERQEAKLRESQRQELELRHMRELWESEARYADVVRSAMDAIIIFDQHGTITTFNAAADRMFGVPAREAVASPLSRLFPSPLDAEAVHRLREAADRGRDAAGGDSSSGPTAVSLGPLRPLTLTGLRRNGEQFPIEASVSGLDQGGGRTYTLIVRDVSERVAAEEALREQALSLERSAAELKALNEELSRRQSELERAMTARSRFYASMSHELRTPINAILGYSTLLLENIYGSLSDKQAEGIQRTHKAAKHLLELVNDVLDLSKIEAGKVDLRPQPVTFPALIDDLFVTVRPLADQHGSTLSLEHEGEPVRIVSDPRRVRQILLNLLSNAIKFGAGKPVRIGVRTAEDGGAVIEVTDQGVGIAPADTDRIFQEFVQLGKTQLQDGTGLGLPISRRLAEMLRGTLEVISDVGRGSTFRLTLPSTIDARVSRAIEQVVEPTVERDGVERGDSADNGAGRQPAQEPWDPAAREAGSSSAAD
jgi:signal transduction histidine kinase/DNA-binding LytR/AlgR family response regulator